MAYATIMSAIILSQRHFLYLVAHTTPPQQRALFQTITKEQLKALGEIAHNIIKGTIPLSPTDQAQFKRERRFLHLLGSKTLGITHKKTLIRSKQRILHRLVTVAVTYLTPVLH